MRKKLVLRDPIRSFQRKATASRRVGANQKCVICGETRPEALIAGSKPPRCAECQRKARGQSSLDAHHVGGKSNSEARISVGVNDHRARLTPAQQDWPPKTLENLHRSPVLALAASNRGFIDAHDYLIEKLLYRSPEMLEALDAFLAEKLGPKWWVGTPLEKYAPKP